MSNEEQGAIYLGFVVIFITMNFVSHLKEHKINGLYSVITLILGGSITQLSGNNKLFWLYCHGLFYGLSAYILLSIIYNFLRKYFKLPELRALYKVTDKYYNIKKDED